MLITASGLTRFIKCPSSAILPHVKTTSNAAGIGTEIHKFLEDAIYLGSEKALSSVRPEIYDRCKNIDITSIVKDYTDIQTEMAYALNPITRKARYLGRNLGRVYGAEAGEIAGSEDIVARYFVNSKTRCVADFKTGDDVGSAKSNSQLLFFAACLYLIEGADEVDGRIIYIREDGSTYIDKAKWTSFDLEDYLDTLADACKRHDATLNKYEKSGDISVSPGDHCRYCGSFSSCPAQVGLARRLLPELEELQSKILSLTPEQAGQAWLMKKKIADIFNIVDEGLKNYARNMDIPLGNGKIIGVSSYEKKYFNQEEALRVMEVLGASKEDIASCYKVKKIETVRELKERKE